MTRKMKTLSAILLFVVLFGGLLAAATFTDLQVSQILTKNVLEPGRYYTEHVFGAAMEAVGTAPEYLMGAFMLLILFWSLLRFEKRGAARGIGGAVSALASAVLLGAWFRELMGYITRHFDTKDVNTAFLWGVIVFLTLLSTLLLTLAVRNFSDDSLKKLWRFALVSCIAMVTATLIVQGIKIPFGRMRYRSMNVIGDFSGFTRWYKIGGQPDKEWMRAVFGTSDAFKSFPSGHTRGAAATFYLPAMGSVLGLSGKKRLALWCFALVFTGAVALSRIMVGAHFFSDVLVGGTVGFLCCFLFREFFVDRCENVKALFGK